MLFNEEIALTLNELFRMAVEDYGLVLGVCVCVYVRACARARARTRTCLRVIRLESWKLSFVSYFIPLFCLFFLCSITFSFITSSLLARFPSLLCSS